MCLLRKNFGVLTLSVLLAIGAALIGSQCQARQSTLQSLAVAPLGNNISWFGKLVGERSGVISQPNLLCLRSEQNASQVNSVKANGTQLKYWIELDRDGKKLHVTNQETFRTGDKIKFHLQSSTDGFLYIVLRTGSRGEQEILFPHPKLKDDNHIAKNVDYVLPADDYLLFDEFPGTEKLVLMFSHKPIELKQAMASKNRVVLRGREGSKDLVPASASVSYTGSDSATPSEPAISKSAPAQATSAGTTATVSASGGPGGAGAAVAASAQAANAHEAPTSAKTSSAQTGANGSSTTFAAPAAAGVQQSHGDVVVQHDDPTQVLTVDIDLVHK